MMPLITTTLGMMTLITKTPLPMTSIMVNRINNYTHNDDTDNDDINNVYTNKP